MTSTTEVLRAQHRTGIPSEVLLRWRKHKFVWHTTGMTRDVSTHGVYVHCDEPPPFGAVVRCRFLVAAESTDGEDIEWEAVAIGRVCRVERTGFAARLRRFLLREPEM